MIEIRNRIGPHGKRSFVQQIINFMSNLKFDFRKTTRNEEITLQAMQHNSNT